MWARLKQSYRELKDDEPGHRFVNAHMRWKERTRNWLATVAIIAVGLLLIVAGGFLGLVPGAPGIVLGVLGVALIGTRFKRVAIWLDWLEVRLRQLWHRCRQAFAR